MYIRVSFVTYIAHTIQKWFETLHLHILPLFECSVLYLTESMIVDILCWWNECYCNQFD